MMMITIMMILTTIKMMIMMILTPSQSLSILRTVFTFVGDPDSIVQAALNAAKVAFDLIDMRRHTGEHPRLYVVIGTDTILGASSYQLISII